MIPFLAALCLAASPSGAPEKAKPAHVVPNGVLTEPTRKLLALDAAIMDLSRDFAAAKLQLSRDLAATKLPTSRDPAEAKLQLMRDQANGLAARSDAGELQQIAEKCRGYVGPTLVLIATYSQMVAPEDRVVVEHYLVEGSMNLDVGGLDRASFEVESVRGTTKNESLSEKAVRLHQAIVEAKAVIAALPFVAQKLEP